MRTPPSAAIGLGPEFADALLYTYELHARQQRKGTDGPPYIGHLLAVAGMVIDVGGSEDEAIAASLHDAAEDQGGEERLEKLERRFGSRVAEIVRECSDTTSLEKEDWSARKQRYIDSIADKSAAAVRVSLADKLHNANAIIRDQRLHGDSVWERFSATKEEIVDYYGRLRDAFGKRIDVLEERFPHFRDFADAVSVLEGGSEVGAAAL